MDVAELSGLPAGAVERLRAAGIEQLYPPQARAVEAGVTDGENVVAAVPTASGKTLIAELAMLSAIERGGTALYIVPLRALASEKRAEFERWGELGVEVGVSTGNYESDGEWLASRDLIVATSEKVDSLVRNGAPWIDDLACVVADEVHLVDDAERGPTLEVTLAKLRRLNPDLQTVALSATIGNAAEIADWLDAALVDSEWRPIDLKRGVHYGSAVNFADGEQLEVPVERGQKQEAALVADALDRREEGVRGSSLVFVNSRRNAESAARRLAGLAGEQRSLVEDAFRERLIKVVCATPTLAAGVNTPARRVIVRDWRRYDPEFGGMKPLDALEVHQMMGRAGRPGLDPYGEAILLADDRETMDELFDRYLWADPEPVRSKLAAEPALRTHVLATVASGFATSREGLLSFLDRTLYAAQADDDSRLRAVTDDVIDYLVANDFLERGTGTLAATGLGHTVSRLYLDPMSAAEIVDGLTDATAQAAAGGDPEEGFTPASELGNDAETGGDASADLDASPLGLYQLVARTPDMYRLYLNSGERETYTEQHYEREGELLGRPPSEYEDVRFEEWLAALKTARLLEDWAQEVDEDRITERYGVGPGDVRGKVETAEWLLGAAERLATELGVDAAPIRAARKRIEYGVRAELLDLAGVRGIGRKRARRLFEAGIESRADLREAEKATVLRAVRGRAGTAERILENVGRRDPSMDGVDADGAGRGDEEGSEAGAEGQASLGDFG